MTADPKTDATITALLKQPATVAVVWLSPKPHSDIYNVAQIMQAAGWRIVPVNPVATGAQILGETVYATLAQACAATPIELVDVFRNSEDASAVVDEAIALRLSAVWLQLGVRNDAAAERARAAGLAFVQDRCLKIEWRRLHGA